MSLRDELRDATELARDKRELERLCGQARIEIDRLTAQLAEARKEVEGMRKDAERYRWLKSTDRSKKDLEIVLHDEDEFLDSAIDAAIAESGEVV